MTSRERFGAMGLDPVQDRIDLAEVKRGARGRLCLTAGIGGHVDSMGEAQIAQDVEAAMGLRSTDGGFILYPFEAVFNDMSWQSVETLIRPCRRHAGGGNT